MTFALAIAFGKALASVLCLALLVAHLVVIAKGDE